MRFGPLVRRDGARKLQSVPLFCPTAGRAASAGPDQRSARTDWQHARYAWPARGGTPLASGCRRRDVMFAVSAILIGVLGIFFVRRRSARKKQGLA